MLQIYPFHSTDVQEVYEKLNCFLAELSIIDVQVPLESIRANTKFYPDWDRTATTIEVCVDLSDSLAPHEIASQIRDLHRAVVNGKSEPEVEDPIAEAYRLIAEAQFAPGRGVFLDHKEEGWVLTDLRDQGHVFYGVHRSDVLERVQKALASMGAQPAKAPAGDNFDPFLDGDELP